MGFLDYLNPLNLLRRNRDKICEYARKILIDPVGRDFREFECTAPSDYNCSLKKRVGYREYLCKNPVIKPDKDF